MTVRVLTFNIRQIPLLSVLEHPVRRARQAAALVLAHRPDVVVLNEAHPLSGTWLLLARLRRAGYRTTPQIGTWSGRRRWTGTSGRWNVLSGFIGGGVSVLSTLPIDELHQHIYHARDLRTQDRLSHKGVALVRLRTADGPLWIAATHLQADEDGTYPATHDVRMAQLAEARAAIAAVVPPAEPVVIAGDLNVEYWDSAARPGHDHVAAARSLGGRLLPDGPVHEHTYDTTVIRLASRECPDTRNVLDYIGSVDENGHRPALHISTATLPFPRGEEPSDHYPVLGTVRLT
ncbi:endonuclease/exonuclease/phosphatase family protein [Pseudonocardia sp. GCM10023141]|uniref:endonuclease/exonuclease/phosphatase family protein n=1 Tax=Pseudonocardia sp. GCM10023141 TaxID=3252653 RepID=UPI0036062E5D